MRKRSALCAEKTIGSSPVPAPLRLVRGRKVEVQEVGRAGWFTAHAADISNKFVCP